MPEMDGLETTRQIIKLYKEKDLKPPPIVCLTAYTDDSYKDASYAAGMDYFVIKPANYNNTKEVLQMFNIKFTEPVKTQFKL